MSNHLSYCLCVNGQNHDVSAPAHLTLLDVLRDVLRLTGTKECCAEGECGACTVALIGNDGGGSAYRAVNSCLILLPTIADHEVYTVEALSSGAEATDLQRQFAAAGASQCGYCTPGFVMSLFAEQYRPDRDGPCDPLALSGNLCRCTGYRPILAAAESMHALPAHRFVIHKLNGGDVRYLYAEPNHCVCVFIGNQANYTDYRSILSQPLPQADNVSTNPTSAAASTTWADLVLPSSSKYRCCNSRSLS